MRKGKEERLDVLKKLLTEWDTDKNQLLDIAEPLIKSGYGEYLLNLVKSNEDSSGITDFNTKGIKYN